MTGLLVGWLFLGTGVALRMAACWTVASCRLECYTARWWVDAAGSALMRLAVPAGLCVLLLVG